MGEASLEASCCCWWFPLPWMFFPHVLHAYISVPPSLITSVLFLCIHPHLVPHNLHLFSQPNTPPWHILPSDTVQTPLTSLSISLCLIYNLRTMRIKNFTIVFFDISLAPLASVFCLKKKHYMNEKTNEQMHEWPCWFWPMRHKKSFPKTFGKSLPYSKSHISLSLSNWTWTRKQ